MFHIFTRITRVSNQPPKQCLQHISRSFCYKPVERNFAAPANKIFNRLKRRKKTPTIEYNFDTNAECIKPARDKGRSLDIIRALPADPKEFTAESLIDAYDKLSMGPISDEALVHENFDTFIDATELILPKLSVSQNVHIFKQTVRAQIPMFDELTELIAKALLGRIKFITVEEIIDVDFALRKYYARAWRISRLLETLRQAARSEFKVKVNDELVERQSHRKLMRIVRYLSNNQSLVQNIDSVTLSEQLLLDDDHKFQLNDVVCTIVTLSRFPALDAHSKQLLTKMYRIWYGQVRDIDDVKTILKLLNNKKLENGDLPHFHDPLFVQRCTQIVIEKNDMRSAFDVLNEFNELNFPSTELIDFLSIVFNTDKHKKVKIDDYATFCTACEKAHHKPSNWDSKVVPAIKRAKLQETNFFKQVDLAMTLHHLGIRHNGFIEHFFSSAQLQHWHKNNSRLAEVHKAYSIERTEEVSEPETPKNITPYMSWLTSDLEKFIGANKVLNNVTLSDELTVPLVLKVNTETGHFIDMKKSTELQNLMCDKNELLVGVITQDIGSMKDNFEIFAEQLNKQRKIIKDRGWIAITLDESLYGTMETYKRAFTFFKIILYAINNRTRKP